MMPRFVKHPARKAPTPRVSPEQARFAAQQAALRGAMQRSKNQADRQRVTRAAVQHDLKNRFEAMQEADASKPVEKEEAKPLPRDPAKAAKARVRREG
jgi:hypothetical protein